MTYRACDELGLNLNKLLEEIDALVDSAKISALLAKLLVIYDLKSVAYLGAGLTDHADRQPYLAVTYSPEWVEHYRREQFVDVDPASPERGKRKLAFRVERWFGYGQKRGVARGQRCSA